MTTEEERDEFLRQALDPTVCFLCAAPVEADERSREHVFAKWMQDDYQLWDQRLTLLNRTTIPYRQVTITCCTSCNRERLSAVEGEVSAAFRAGTGAVRRLDRETLFIWLAKFYYGLLFRDMSLLSDRKDPTQGTLVNAEWLRQFGIHHLLLRRVLGEVTWTAFPASIFIFEALESTNRKANFDYFDAIDQPFVAVRCGGTYVAAFLQDFGAVEMFCVGSWQQVAAARELKLHPLQCTELNALFLTVLKQHHPASLVVGRTGNSWRVIVSPRGGLSGAPPFDAWSRELYETILRRLFGTVTGTQLEGPVGEISSFLFDRDGSPFQAPSLEWLPEAPPNPG